MTDGTLDTLRQTRAAVIQASSRERKADYLRSRGWRRLPGNKQQRWQAPNGAVATLASAVTIELLADLAESP